MGKKKRINPSFLENDWEKIQNYGTAENKSMSEVVRGFTLIGIKRELLHEKQMESIKNLLHIELETVNKKVDELKKTEMKACEAAATSMYLLEYFCSNIKMADEENVAKAILDAKQFAIAYVLAEEEKDDA